MAIVVDAARDSAVTQECANTVYQTGNDHADTPDATWDIAFTLTASVADSHIETIDTDGSATAPTASPQAAAMFVDYSAFWLDSTPATVRF